MQDLFNERGASKFKVFLFLAILFLVIHAGLKLVPMYMDAERMEDEMRMKASVAQVLKDDEILAALAAKAKDLELPLTAENFVVQRDEEKGRMKITTKWDVELNFLWGTYVRQYHFEPVIDESYSSAKR